MRNLHLTVAAALLSQSDAKIVLRTCILYCLGQLTVSQCSHSSLDEQLHEETHYGTSSQPVAGADGGVGSMQKGKIYGDSFSPDAATYEKVQEFAFGIPEIAAVPQAA